MKNPRTRAAARRLITAHARYKADPTSLRAAQAYERALERYRAARTNTRPAHLKGERL
jgi:hypothetical protein